MRTCKCVRLPFQNSGVSCVRLLFILFSIYRSRILVFCFWNGCETNIATSCHFILLKVLGKEKLEFSCCHAFESISRSRKFDSTWVLSVEAKSAKSRFIVEALKWQNAKRKIEVSRSWNQHDWQKTGDDFKRSILGIWLSHILARSPLCTSVHKFEQMPYFC